MTGPVWRSQRRAAGLCCSCNEPLFRGGRCERHYAGVLASNRKGHAAKRVAAGVIPGRPRRGGRTAKLQGAPPGSLVGWHVYTLHDPDTDAVRYVGMTDRPRRRWYLHRGTAVAIRRGQRAPVPVGVWFGALDDMGKRPVMKIVAPAESEAAALDLERATIQRLTAEGVDLLNVQGYAKLPPTCGRCGKVGHKRTKCQRPPMTNAEQCRARHEKLAASGCCLWCSEPSVPGRSRCARCIETGAARAREREARQRAERTAAGIGKNVCRGCGGVGHNRRTCAAVSRAA